MRGLFAVVVVLSHLRNNIPILNDTALGSLLTASGYLSVGIFFFLSGFGLRESFEKKSGYIHSFPQNRLIPFYCDYLLFLMVYLVFRMCSGRSICGSGILSSLFWGGTYVENGWYFQVAMLIYLSFYVSYLMTKNNCRLVPLALCVFLIIYIVICLLTYEEAGLFLQSISGVVLGFIWSCNQIKLRKAISKHFVFCLLSSFLAFSITLLWGNWYATGILRIIIKNCSVCFFAASCICIFCIVPIQCCVTKFLGEISLELYAIHGLFLGIFMKNPLTVLDSVTYAVEVISCSIVAAWVLHQFIKRFNAWLKQKLTQICKSRRIE